MNLKNLVLIDILEIVSKYKNTPSHELSLKLAKNKTLPHRAIAEQVECSLKAMKKLPSLSKKPILFDKIALEQSSSELTAKYKSSLISGNFLIDLLVGLE